MIFGQFFLFENMISRVDIKSMPKYGYERDLGLGCRLLGDQNKIVGANVGCYNGKKGCGCHVGHYKGKNCCGRCH
jgi:hypothetical protein